MGWVTGRIKQLQAQLAACHVHADSQERLMTLTAQRLRDENVRRVEAERRLACVAELTTPLVTRWLTDPEGLQERYLEIREAVNGDGS